MSLPPTNVQVFIAAYTGAIGGMAVGSGWITDPVAAHYDNLCDIAGAYANAIDTAWNDPSDITDLEYDKIQCCSEAIFSERPSQPAASQVLHTASNWAVAAAAVVALVDQADSWLSTHGVTPSGPVGNGVKRARGVVTAKLPVDLTQFVLNDLPANDGITYVLGDTLIAIGEFSREDGPEAKAEPSGPLLVAPISPENRNGPWVVTAVNVDGIHGTLTRPSWWADGATLQTSGVPIEVGSEGIFFANTRWRAMGPQTNDIVSSPQDTFLVGTDDPGMYPEIMTQLIQLTEGVGEVFAPILSVTSGISIADRVGRPNTTVYYQVTGGMIPGNWNMGGCTITAMTVTGDTDESSSALLLVTTLNQSWQSPLPP